jgi:serine/threonine protein kinase
MQTQEPTATIRPCPQCGTSVRFRQDPSSGRESCPRCGYVLPNQVAHFKLLNIIGTGGMGAVYKGLDTSLERNVAVKVMREGFAKDHAFLERFLREARAAAALNHPNVAQIYSFGEQNSRYYLVIELLPNGSLDDRIEKERRLSEVEVLDIGIQVASGLRAAYERGLIHRDIKPGNILFAQDGTAKVVDFGLARFEAKENNQEEGIWGTPYYIAPEKVSDNKEDVRSDIYSLGGTLFHALAGRPPFEAGTSTEVVLKHLHSPSVSLRSFAPDCTPQTAEVIGRMLKRDPTDRPQTYDELLSDLAYAKRFALEKRPPAPVEVEKDFSVGMLVSTLIIIVVACIGAATWLWFKGGELFRPEPKAQFQSTPQGTVISVKSSTNNVSRTSTNATASTTLPRSNPQNEFLNQVRQGYEQSNGDLLALIAHLEKIAPPRSPVQASFLKLHIARAKLVANMESVVENRETEALATLESIAGSVGDAVTTPLPDTQHPQVLALALYGRLSTESIDKIVPTRLPEWMRAAIRFDAGLAATRQEETLKETVHHWQEYVKMEHIKDQPWVLTYQEKARQFLKEYEALQEFNSKLAPIKDDPQKMTEVQDLLKEYQGKWNVVTIQNSIKKIAEENRTAIEAFQKEQDDQRKAALEKQQTDEKKLLDEVLAQKQQLIPAYHFEKYLTSAQAASSKIALPENRKIIEQELATAQVLAGFKTGLIKDVQNFPYNKQQIATRSNRKMEGNLYKIVGEELSFRIEIKELGPEAYAEKNCLWQELPPQAIYTLSDFYLERSMNSPEPNNSEIARRAIAQAVLVREFRLKETYLRTLFGIIQRTGSNVKEQLEKLNFQGTP